MTGLFDGVFARGAAADAVDDAHWLRALLDAEAALARAAARAGLVDVAAAAAVTEAADRVIDRDAVVRDAAGGACDRDASDRDASDRDAGGLGIAGLSAAAAGYGNPVPPLVRALSAAVPAGAREAVHVGATSQDIMDTAMMLLVRRAAEAILADLGAAADAVAGLAARYRDTAMIGRTLLQQAQPTTFGMLAATWLSALDRARARLSAMSAGLPVQYGGAVGTLAASGGVGTRIAALLADELELTDPGLPWHTDRQPIVDIVAALAGAGGACGKAARDVTLLAQGEVAEVAEAGAGGSSAMPHKRNPVAAISVLGCTRQLPGLAASLLAATEQEYQRAAGAWHAEWLPLTSMLALTGSAASWSAASLCGLRVDTAALAVDLAGTGGLPQASRVAELLAPGVGRIAAHDLVRAAAARAATAHRPLRDVLLDDRDARRAMTDAGAGTGELDAALDPATHLGAARELVDRALAAHRESTVGPGATREGAR